MDRKLQSYPVLHTKVMEGQGKARERLVKSTKSWKRKWFSPQAARAKPECFTTVLTERQLPALVSAQQSRAKLMPWARVSQNPNRRNSFPPSKSCYRLFSHRLALPNSRLQVMANRSILFLLWRAQMITLNQQVEFIGGGAKKQQKKKQTQKKPN